MTDPNTAGMLSHLFANWGTHLSMFLAGASGMGIVSHAVNTFPTPENKYGAWLLGVIQMAVGQRTIAKNTLQGLQTETKGVDTGGAQQH